ncbi:MAG TPA: hypothetical protein VNI84_16765 [Pyrinomonadaceae bacterium]|nr:hypothetical protein [Pyrinomonadaceae bacterium]
MNYVYEKSAPGARASCPHTSLQSGVKKFYYTRRFIKVEFSRLERSRAGILPALRLFNYLVFNY